MLSGDRLRLLTILTPVYFSCSGSRMGSVFLPTQVFILVSLELSKQPVVPNSLNQNLFPLKMCAFGDTSLYLLSFSFFWLQYDLSMVLTISLSPGEMVLLVSLLMTFRLGDKLAGLAFEQVQLKVMGLVVQKVGLLQFLFLLVERDGLTLFLFCESDRSISVFCPCRAMSSVCMAVIFYFSRANLFFLGTISANNKSIVYPFKIYFSIILRRDESILQSLSYLGDPLQPTHLQMHVSFLLQVARLFGVRVYPDQTCVVVLGKQLLHHVADCRDGLPTPNFNENLPPRCVSLYELAISLLLLETPLIQPLPISEHENIGPEVLSAFLTLRQIPTAHSLLVNLGQEVVLCYLLAIVALKMVYTPVDLIEMTGRVVCSLEVPVDVRSKREVVLGGR